MNFFVCDPFLILIPIDYPIKCLSFSLIIMIKEVGCTLQKNSVSSRNWT